MKARIYIVDDELMAIQYLKYLLQEAGVDYEVIGEATNGVKAVPEILRWDPDIVFADISMPVMDGLQMSEEIMKKNKKIKIVLLTSYRDFDYAKRGMKIGVTDYVLKNELSEDYLKDLISKIMQESLKEKKAQHLMIEHNLREFLLSNSVDLEDRIYEHKPFQRYALISIVIKPKVHLTLSSQQEHVIADCFELENLTYPNGITCRAVVKLADGEWCGVFFIDGTVPDSALKLKETAELIADAFQKYSDSCVYLISNTTKQFVKLQEIYKEQKKLIGYLYACKSQQILRAEDMNKINRKHVPMEAYMENLEKQLQDENREEALQSVKQILETSQRARNVWEYTEDLRSIYNCLKKYMQERKIDQEALTMNGNCFDPDRVEETFTCCLDSIFEEINRKKHQRYSYYIILAIEYISKNYDKDISIPDIAESIKISEGHLRKCFKQETNKTIVDYLTEYRLNRAKHLMKNGERRIDEVWQKTGFTSSQYFSYVFKRNEGMTPSDYIRQVSR